MRMHARACVYVCVYDCKRLGIKYEYHKLWLKKPELIFCKRHPPLSDGIILYEIIKHLFITFNIYKYKN